jgi:hypothetical protein
VGFEHWMHATNLIELAACTGRSTVNTLRRQLPWVMGEPVLALTRIFRKDAGHAQVSPLHHACLFPCNPDELSAPLPSPGAH